MIWPNRHIASFSLINPRLGQYSVALREVPCTTGSAGTVSTPFRDGSKEEQSASEMWIDILFMIFVSNIFLILLNLVEFILSKHDRYVKVR